MASPHAVAASEAQAAELITGVEQTTKDAVKKLVVQAFEEGWTPQKLTDAIEAMPEFGPDRAALIARTEMNRAIMSGHVAAWREANHRFGLGTLKKTVLGTNENHCPICLAANREGAIPLDEGFHGLGDPPFHPNCWCNLVPVRGKPVEALAKADAPSFDPDQPRDADGKWTAARSQGERERGERAIKQLLADRKGTINDAMEVKGVGKICMFWGFAGFGPPKWKGGFGIAHVVAKHGEADARRIPEILTEGTFTATDKEPLSTSSHIEVRYGKFTVALTRGGNGVFHGASPTEPWVLTGYLPTK